MTNPFEDPDRLCLVLADDEGRHSLWLASVGIPPGWAAAYGPARRQDCLDYVAGHGTAVRPAPRPYHEPAAGPTELFEAWAARTPDAVAVTCAGTSLTYAELQSRVDEVVDRLLAQGVGPGDLVALLLPRSTDLVVALLAVLESGAAYVPLDPDYPPERIGYVLGDAAPSVLVTTCAAAGDGVGGGIPRLLMGAEEPSTAGPVPHTVPKPQQVSGGHPAYVIYTSGSTGRPKGVVVPRSALMNFLAGMAELFPLSPADRLVAVTTIAFDIAALEIYLPLLAGAHVVVAPKDVVRDPEALAELIRGFRATIMQATPSLWQALVSDVPDSLRGLRMLVGGEALPAALGEAMRNLGSEVTNLYGPTETTIWSTAQRVDGSAESASIGRPIRNTRVHVLDDALRPVATGEVGELYIAGDGLAHGYLGRPELTAERFVANPFEARATRMYRTGDLVRQASEGTLEYLSRVDFQVKIRGFRIELAEIENVVADHDGVAQAAVTVDEARPGDARLICHVVPAPGQTVDPHAVREFAARLLPDYMVPSLVAVRDAFPLTPNGKLDRKALAGLPLPAAAGLRDAEVVAPSDDSVLGAVAAAWQHVLGTPVRSGRSFAAHGGTSLGATRAAARLRELTGKSVSVADVLGAASPEELAELTAAAPAHVDRTATRDTGRTRASLSAQQRAIWIHEQLAPDPLLYLETYCLELHGALDPQRLAQAVRKAALHHPAVGAAVEVEADSTEPRLVLGRHRISLTPRPVPKGLSDTQLLALLRKEAARPIRLAQGPLLRCLLFRAPDRPVVLLLAWHHIVMDGWGLRLFLDDLTRFYNCPQATPDPGRVTLCDLNTWLDEADADPAVERAVERATAQLESAVRTAQEAEPAHWSAEGATQAAEFAFPEALARQVDRAAAAAGHTAFVLLCAAYRCALTAVLGLEHPLVAVAVSGRDIPESETLVGCFVDTVLLGGEQPGPPGAMALLAHTREALERARGEQERIPFPRLVRRLRETIDLPMDFPRFYLSLDEEPVPRFDGLHVRTLPTNPDRAKFGVTMSLLLGEGGLTGRMEHRTSVLAPAGAQQFLKAFESVLSEISGACLEASGAEAG